MQQVEGGQAHQPTLANGVSGMFIKAVLCLALLFIAGAAFGIWLQKARGRR
ncbi:hypothetical protein GCM10010109_59240 [Actinoplanes campanulatus]|nr:hypothetical protein GCM10010109_59240 [Actinoplanes campanulatus]GID39148.1 hypothetical protein Aca09nite_56540 [Actinoplanes campanulatus]